MAGQSVRVFLVGDVMLGRGIDQILAHSCDPILYEGNGSVASDYVLFAEAENGKLPPKKDRGVDYVWGYTIEVLQDLKPDLRVINLETAVTTSEEHWPEKVVSYRMHPGNMDVLQTAGIQCCVLANNHVLDWGYPGLLETLSTLQDRGVVTAGAGRTVDEACAPAVFSMAREGREGRVLVFGVGHPSAGVFPEWRVTEQTPGVHVIDIHSPQAVQYLAALVKRHKRVGDIAVLSMHWGGNWGWEIPDYQREFAHKAVDLAGVDIFHGHSSHHVKGLEVYHGKPIMYGCGDFINDYEGIGSHPESRGDLSLMYFVDMDPDSGVLQSLRMVPGRMRRLQVTKPEPADVQWLYHTMARECEKLDTTIKLHNEGYLYVAL